MNLLSSEHRIVNEKKYYNTMRDLYYKLKSGSNANRLYVDVFQETQAYFSHIYKRDSNLFEIIIRLFILSEINTNRFEFLVSFSNYC